jgi:hypothetical protein
MFDALPQLVHELFPRTPSPDALLSPYVDAFSDAIDAFVGRLSPEPEPELGLAGTAADVLSYLSARSGHYPDRALASLSGLLSRSAPRASRDSRCVSQIVDAVLLFPASLVGPRGCALLSLAAAHVDDVRILRLAGAVLSDGPDGDRLLLRTEAVFGAAFSVATDRYRFSDERDLAALEGVLRLFPERAGAFEPLLDRAASASAHGFALAPVVSAYVDCLSAGRVAALALAAVRDAGLAPALVRAIRARADVRAALAGARFGGRIHTEHDLAVEIAACSDAARIELADAAAESAKWGGAGELARAFLRRFPGEAAAALEVWLPIVAEWPSVEREEVLGTVDAEAAAGNVARFCLARFSNEAAIAECVPQLLARMERETVVRIAEEACAAVETADLGNVVATLTVVCEVSPELAEEFRGRILLPKGWKRFVDVALVGRAERVLALK